MTVRTWDTSRSRSPSISGPPSSPSRVLFVFLDGVGVGSDDPEVNPLFAARLTALRTLAGGALPHADAPTSGSPAGGSTEGSSACAFSLDARLDAAGTPRSGTGQVALLTGADAARLHGAHFGPWTPVKLRPLVEARSVLRRARDHGLDVTFANAYPRGWPGPGGTRRIAAPPLAARGAGVLTRHEEALGRGEAVSSEIVNHGWRRYLGHDWLPEVTPEDAGVNLAKITAEHDLTLYAHYATDTAGHQKSMEAAVNALERVDRFVAGLLSALTDDTLVFVASDHGNIEDVGEGHTTNPALGIAYGPGAGEARGLQDIREVAAFVLGRLGISG